MSHPLGPANSGDAPGPIPGRGPQPQAKKKSCKKQKCSHWKGGKCRCGRE
jgi:hypothetical protein